MRPAPAGPPVREGRVGGFCPGHKRGGAGIPLVGAGAHLPGPKRLRVGHKAAHLAGGKPAAPVKPARKDQRAAHAGAVAHEHKMLQTAARAELRLAHSGGVGVVFHGDRQASELPQDLPHGQAGVAGNVVGQADCARVGVHLAAGANTQRPDALHARRNLCGLLQHGAAALGGPGGRAGKVRERAVFQHAALDGGPADVDTANPHWCFPPF